MKNPAALHAVVSGRVQGVFFRAFTAEKAGELGLTGYVRNMQSGDVEVYAEGEKALLERLADSLKTGPPASRVQNVSLEWAPFTGNHTGFSIRYH